VEEQEKLIEEIVRSQKKIDGFRRQLITLKSDIDQELLVFKDSLIHE
jgi:hypothetical protein